MSVLLASPGSPRLEICRRLDDSLRVLGTRSGATLRPSGLRPLTEAFTIINACPASDIASMGARPAGFPSHCPECRRGRTGTICARRVFGIHPALFMHPMWERIRGEAHVEGHRRDLAAGMDPLASCGTELVHALSAARTKTGDTVLPLEDAARHRGRSWDLRFGPCLARGLRGARRHLRAQLTP